MDLTGWIEYFADGLATQMREVQERGEKVIRRDVFVSKARKIGLKDRPLAVLTFLLDKGKGTIAPSSRSPIARIRTAQTP